MISYNKNSHIDVYSGVTLQQQYMQKKASSSFNPNYNNIQSAVTEDNKLYVSIYQSLGNTTSSQSLFFFPFFFSFYFIINIFLYIYYLMKLIIKFINIFFSSSFYLIILIILLLLFFSRTSHTPHIPSVIPLGSCIDNGNL